MSNAIDLSLHPRQTQAFQSLATEPPLGNERWRSLNAYGAHWRVSSHGRVKKLVRTRWDRQGTMVLLRCTRCKGGYVKQGNIRVHQLVARAFIPNPRGLEHINHIDGDKQNNLVCNLEWTTIAENNAHAHRTGLAKRPPNMAGHNRLELPEWAVPLLGTMSDADVASAVGCYRSTISRKRSALGIVPYATTTGNNGQFRKGHFPTRWAQQLT